MIKINLFTRNTRVLMRYSILFLIFILPSIALATIDKAVLAEQPMTLDQAVKQVKKNKQGKVLAAETKQIEGNAPVHIIKILTNKGRVKKIRIKAKQGK